MEYQSLETMAQSCLETSRAQAYPGLRLRLQGKGSWDIMRLVYKEDEEEVVVVA